MPTARSIEQQIILLAEWIQTANSIVFFGGAGVSTESGIPDYRSESGLYASRAVYGHSPEELLSHTTFVREPDLFFKYYKENLIAIDARPNLAHQALAELEARGKLKAVITQNVDGLHQSAGSQVVYELHGSNWRQFCVDCGTRYSLQYILDTANCRGFIPICKKCGGIVRPAVVLYEEQLESSVVDAAVTVIKAAELMIIGGTSLAVYPAAGLIRYFNGQHLVLINKSPTAFDQEADLVINAAIGELLDAVMRLVD
ncbi:MAG: NAD-dependent protein deacylase [Coriobacteriales bacterium]|jgi:NAD-dependent deacetylase|nr:NAD-dependent protein deacylase [Coriobacteriales bacterium]